MSKISQLTNSDSQFLPREHIVSLTLRMNPANDSILGDTYVIALDLPDIWT